MERKSYKEQIAVMLESLSSLGIDDIEEARELLRAAGKDPDLIVRAGIEKLGMIQQNTKSGIDKTQRSAAGVDISNEQFQILVLDSDMYEIVLTDDLQSDRNIKAHDAYDLLVRKTDTSEISYAGLMFSIDVQNLKFSKHNWDLRFTISVGADTAHVTAETGRAGSFLSLSYASLISIVRNGYVVYNGWWRPIDSEALNFASEMLHHMVGPAQIPIPVALKYFSKRHEIRYVRFDPETADFGKILSSETYASISSLFIRDLYDYQKDGLKWLQYCCLNHIGGLLGDDMGLGKTAQIIALTAWIVENDVLPNVLIIVPSTLLENWRREFEFFSPSIKPYIHHGNVRTGSAKFLASQKVVITSYSMIINDMYLFNKISWGLATLDEGSLIRNPDSERRIALNHIPSTVRIAMTGTPVENSLLDLWSIIDFIQPDYLGTRDQFLERYNTRDIRKLLDSAKLEQLKTDVSYIMLRRKKEDVLHSLPEKIDIHQALTMKGGEAQMYENYREKIVGQENEPGKFLKLIQDLRQLTTHPILLNDDKAGKYAIQDLRSASAKFDRTCELLDEIRDRNEKVLIFTEYLGMIDTIKTVIQDHYKIPVYTIDGRVDILDRQNNIDLFSRQDGFGVMVLNPRTAGMGLNITAANHVIHYTRQWNPALEMQASARAYRNGQKKGVNIYYLYYADTIEEVIDERLRLKTDLSSEIITESDTAVGMDEYLVAIHKSPLNR